MQAIERGAKVAVIGDGKFGLLIAQSLAVSGMPGSLTHFGRHSDKMALVTGDITRHIVDDDTKSNFAMVRCLSVFQLGFHCAPRVNSDTKTHLCRGEIPCQIHMTEARQFLTVPMTGC